MSSESDHFNHMIILAPLRVEFNKIKHRKQDFAPFISELLGGLSGPQTP